MISILTTISTIIIDYYIINLLYYGYHRFIHLPIAGSLYRAHFIGHHKTEFPLRSLRADSYSADGSGGWFQTGGELVFGIPVICILLIAYMTLDIYNFIILVGVIAGVIITGDIAHSSYHLNSTATNHPESLKIHKWLVMSDRFIEYRKLHDIHHAKNNCNYGFADMTMDRLFGTYTEIPPPYLKYFS